MLFLLTQAVDRVAETRPERVALRCRGESLSYGELALRSNALARRIAETKLPRGSRVGIYARKGLEAAVGLYGVMKAGCAYVPLDAFAPISRTRQIVASCAMSGLVTETSREHAVRDILASDTADSLRFIAGLEGDDLGRESIPWSTVSEEGVDGPPDVGATEQDPAYVLYTSGSTGTPKGILHTHRSALSWAEVAASTYGLGPSDRVSNHAPLHFDLSTLDYFASAVAGSTTVIVPEEHTKLPASLSQLMEDEKLTVLYCVPFALTQLALYGALESRDLGALRWVLFGGEPLPPKHLRALMKLLPHARFGNVYGPTEVNGCTYFNLPESGWPDDAPIPIGRPYPNVEALVVDEDDLPVPEGEIGELLIRAPTMMRGYWGDPQLSERAFYRIERYRGFEEVFHRTGDLVQRLDDGNLRFVGRKDRQVKVRGHRLELDEIEGALASHPDVAEAAVVVAALAEEDGRLALLAAVTHRSPEAPSRRALLGHLRQRLPAYAVPERIEMREAFPRTTTGKIDRRRLAEELEPTRATVTETRG